MPNKSLLAKATLADVKTSPFPHLVLTNVLPDELCLQLLKEFPPLSTVAKGKDLRSNRRFDYSVNDIRKDPSISPLWRSLVEGQVSNEFWQDVVRLFGSEIKRLYPQIALDSLSRGIFGTDTYSNVDLISDAHISVNTPVVFNPGSVRGAHLDDGQELYAALFYLRHPDDRSTGGSLELFRVTTPEYKMHGHYIDNKYLEKFATVPYERNTLVFFINTPHSIHGVSVREKTNMPRYFVNIIGNFEKPIFDVSSLQEHPVRQKIRKLFARARNKVWKTK